MNIPGEMTAADHLWQVLQAQADDMFALYQLAQLLSQSAEVDEIAQLALPELVRVSDGSHAAMFLPAVDGKLDLIAFIGPDVSDAEQLESMLEFADDEAALAWFQAASGLDVPPAGGDRAILRGGVASTAAHDGRQPSLHAVPGCLTLPLVLGIERAGLVVLSAPSRDGFSRHEQHLLGTMAREVERALQLAMAHSELRYRQQQVERMKTDFVAAVSHDLRTPLALIQASVDSLTHLPVTAEQRNRFISDIGQAAAQLTHQVDTILRFSALEEGHPNMQMQPVDLAECVARTVRQWGPTQQRITFRVPPILVEADPGALQQVITNIIANALKYSPEDAPVRIRGRAWQPRTVEESSEVTIPASVDSSSLGPTSAAIPERAARQFSARGGIALLDIRDWGQGIPSEDLPFLFTKFFRASNARQSSRGGTGLGLHIAKRLIESQGGSIRLRSRLGRGTSVRICMALSTGASN